MKYTEWHNLYKESWGAEIVPEAYSHPAKYSRGLIRQIYAHLLAEGHVKPGDTVADCFGGVALGALDAMRNGLHWRGCELEPKFVGLGNANLDLWNTRYSAHFAGWGTAVLVQGDSRQLAAVLGEAACLVTSPPFVGTLNARKGEDYSSAERFDSDKGFHAGLRELASKDYGDSPGQLGAMKEGDVAAIDWVGKVSGIISSPPYESAINASGEGPGAYGSTSGSYKKHGEYDKKAKEINSIQNAGEGYGSTPANIGNESGDTFWAASAEILRQCHQILTPGGVAAFVAGDFVRKGKRVYFGRQWLDLCVSVGFEPLEWITAWKQEPGPTQTAMFGEDVDLTIDRVSFFRRLANKNNPDNAILNEDVILVRKPEGEGGDGLARAVVTSPPFVESLAGGKQTGGILGQQARGENQTAGGSFAKSLLTDYGQTPGQLGAMKEGKPPE